MRQKLHILYRWVVLKWMKFIYKGRIAVLQKKRWKIIHKALKQSPFYAEYADQNCSLTDYPVIDKYQAMDKFESINTQGIRLDDAIEMGLEAQQPGSEELSNNHFTVGISSGKNEERRIFLSTDKELALWFGTMLDRVIGFSFKPRTVALFIHSNRNLFEAINSGWISFEFFDPGVTTAQNLDELNALHPNVLVARPRVLLELAKHGENHELSIQPEQVIAFGEILNQDDLAYLNEVFDQNVQQVYVSTEGILASPCEHGTLHFNEDLVYVEKKFVDNEHKRFRPIITNLTRTLQPVVRFELDDIVLEKSNCPCGSKMIAIEQIEGRASDVLEFETINGERILLYQSELHEVIKSAADTSLDYFLIQKALRELHLFIDAHTPLYESVQNELMLLFESRRIMGVSIQRIQSRPINKGEKLRRIQNHSPGKNDNSHVSNQYSKRNLKNKDRQKTP